MNLDLIIVSQDNKFALVPRPSSAVEKNKPGMERILSGMVAETLVLAHVGEAEAAFNRGCDYYNGNGVPLDYKLAAKYFRDAAEKGHVAAQDRLGFCYEYGKGVTEDKHEAVRWFRIAAEQGYAEAQFNLGWCYESEDPAEALRWYLKAAGHGNVWAQQWLGLCYENGQIIMPQDYVEAAKWFRKAAEQGEAHSQFCLGRCYLNGMGVVMDRVEAFKWFRISDSSEEVASTKALLSPEEFQEAERRVQDFKAVQLVQKVHRLKPRIVLLNDYAEPLQLMELLISDWFKDATILKFQSGEQAWQELERQDPDILITDMERRNDSMDGWAMIPLLVEKKVKYPVVVATALAEFSAENAHETTKAASAAFHNLLEHARRTLNITALAMPFENEELLKVLKACLENTNVETSVAASYPVSILFSAEHIIPNLKAKERFAAIREMVAHLISLGQIKPQDEKVVLDAIIKRENSMSTGLGFGIAIPRGRVDCVKDIILTVGVSSSGVEFDALDEQPVYVSVLSISPANNQSHEAMLQRVTESLGRFLQTNDGIGQLRRCNSAEQMWSILKPIVYGESGV